MKSQTVCFTGHRKLPTLDIESIQLSLEQCLIECINNGYRYFGAGGALGFDTLAAKTVLDLKNRYSHIRLILVLPCKTQAIHWQTSDIREYEWIKSKADKVVYISQNYYEGCMQDRNRHLVDHSSLCICYLTKAKGGTAFTVAYAKKAGVSIINLSEYRAGSKNKYTKENDGHEARA